MVIRCHTHSHPRTAYARNSYLNGIDDIDGGRCWVDVQVLGSNPCDQGARQRGPGQDLP